MLPYLVVCPLVFLAGFVDAVAGGGGLISLPAYLLAGVPTHLAIGTNKLSSALGSTISTGRYLKNGYLRGSWLLKLTGFAVAVSFLGASLGSRLSLVVDDSILRNLLLVVLPVVAFYVLRNRDLGEERGREPLPKPRQYVIVLTAALLIGMYDGFYGPGTGTFLLLILTGPAHFQVREAAALTKVLNLTSNVAALATFLYHGAVVYPLGLTAAVFSIAGHYCGSGMVVRNGRRIVRPVILVVLVILFAKVLTDL